MLKNKIFYPKRGGGDIMIVPYFNMRKI